MGEEKFRNKITWFIFSFSLFVVWVHAYNAELYLGKTEAMTVIYKMEHWIGNGIGQIAVPGFFIISAYLFYRNFEWDILWTKWKSRIHSILIPYLVWNLIYYLGYVIGSRLPWMTDVMGKGIIPFHWTVALDAILGYTYNYVFWYLFQLIILLLLTPLIYLIINDMVAGVLFQLLFWYFLSIGGDFHWLNLDALLYYCFGGYMALHARKFVEGEWTKNRGYVGAVLLVGSILSYQWGLMKGEPFFFVLCRLMAVVGLWLAVSEQRLGAPKSWMTHNFFLYATHFMFVRFINKAGASVLPEIPVVPLFLYLIMPILVIAISTALGAVLRRRIPIVWEVLNGGR